MTRCPGYWLSELPSFHCFFLLRTLMGIGASPYFVCHFDECQFCITTREQGTVTFTYLMHGIIASN